jgi:hypothetical protein
VSVGIYWRNISGDGHVHRSWNRWCWMRSRYFDHPAASIGEVPLSFARVVAETADTVINIVYHEEITKRRSLFEILLSLSQLSRLRSTSIRSPNPSLCKAG